MTFKWPDQLIDYKGMFKDKLVKISVLNENKTSLRPVSSLQLTTGLPAPILQDGKMKGERDKVDPRKLKASL